MIDMWIWKYNQGCIWLWKYYCETMLIMYFWINIRALYVFYVIS